MSRIRVPCVRRRKRILRELVLHSEAACWTLGAQSELGSQSIGWRSDAFESSAAPLGPWRTGEFLTAWSAGTKYQGWAVELTYSYTAFGEYYSGK